MLLLRPLRRGHGNMDGVVGAWNHYGIAVFCLYGASLAEVGYVGLSVTAPVILGVVTLGWVARNSSGDACGAVAAEEVSPLTSVNDACVAVLGLDKD
jgi:hypothetical protein